MAYKVKSDQAQAALRRVGLQRSGHDVTAMEEMESLNLRLRALEKEVQLFPKGSSQRRAISADMQKMVARISEIKSEYGISTNRASKDIPVHFVNVCEATLPREQFDALMEQALDAYGEDKRARRAEWEAKLGR